MSTKVETVCPRCGKKVRPLTTVDAWDHIVKNDVEWMRELIRLDDDNIKRELRKAFRGIIG